MKKIKINLSKAHLLAFLIKYFIEMSRLFWLKLKAKITFEIDKILDYYVIICIKF